MEFLIPPVELYQFGCRGTVKAWKRCNSNILFTKDVQSSIGYHRYLSTKDLRVLVYSGDHDMVFPYLGTLRWIKRLNSTIVNDWRPWLVDDQIAGRVSQPSNICNYQGSRTHSSRVRAKKLL
ncbi:putative Serine carboxypeptidase [Quillaja saponaria]|uniref:Serine carboxypeptidase n=1 Tax=Quillaja saponaria TaxID=32244 RepID=A0AAD7KRL3_QUISA|nr:putative Serine carboxypeptidase [Quillaja saponaria]